MDVNQEQMNLSESEKVVIVERLRKEKDGMYKRIFEIGRREGFETAKELDYEDISFILEWDIADYSGIDDNRLETFFGYRCLEERDLLSTDGYAPHWLNFRGQAYVEGWKDGVVNFWEKVKDSI